MAQEFRKINVLEMHSSLGFAGGQRNMITFCKYLNKDIFSVFVAAYREGGIQEKRLRSLGMEYLVARGEVTPLRQFIKNKKIDILHIHRSGGYVPLETALLKAAKEDNPRIIIIEKNVFGKFDSVSGTDISCSMFQSMMQLNERYLPAAGKSFDFNTMKVFYNMVDAAELEPYRLTEQQIAVYKKEWGIETGDAVIGKIGRPDLAKWSDLLLEMMPLLIKLVPQIKCVIIGLPDNRRRRIQRSGMANHFIILPPTDDEARVQAFYQVIDVLAHSSKIGECNGNTLNEAMYWKKPIVVNSTPHKDNGQLEQIEHGVNGFIANYPGTYARALHRLVSDYNLRLAMGENGFKKVNTVNHPPAIVKRLEKVFIEQFSRSGELTPDQLVHSYTTIPFSPSEEEIIKFHEVYPQLARQEFGPISIGEWLRWTALLPVRFVRRCQDFIEHRLVCRKF